ncbi:prolipoprotein diacylglyceryl transferase [bacterium]|jgi:phosphatidylglycerol:prolipoprotein diacylglycerol transferase|nr:prolipoprotein diacylglyceryl transferase [bacterium]
MLNWLSSGVINIAGYISPFIFLSGVLFWFLLVKKRTDIRKNRKILIKTGAFSFLGAVISPLLIIILSGKLLPFISSAWKIIQQITSFTIFKNVVILMFRGFSITGGLLILAIVLLFVLKDAKKLTFAIISTFPVFAAVARINCFIKGCCFGKSYDGIFSVIYPPASIASKQHYLRKWIPSRYVESLPVHPTQLYIVASMLLIFLAVVLMNRFKVKKNIISGVVLSGYGLSNFFIEFVREEPLLFNFITVGQIMEIILFAIGLYLIFKVKEEEISESEN